MRSIHGMLLAVVGLAVLGCAARQPERSRGYFGPTQPMSLVLEQIQQNNQRIPQLWGRISFEATVVDEQGKSHFVNGDGNLLYRKPRDLLIRGRKPGVGTVFDIGSNDERFWMRVPVGEIDTMWWGHYRNVGRPCMQPMPIRPDLVLEVLGIGAINENLLTPPVPVMRFNNDADAYMMVWTYPGADRWIAQKEIWYDRATLRPTLVLLFDADGRVVLRAYLTRHKPVEVPQVPREQWPVVATDYRVFFPENKSKMWLLLQDAALSYRNAPSDRSFAFPEDPEVSRIRQIDEDCGS